jgi:hypothetical protein
MWLETFLCCSKSNAMHVAHRELRELSQAYANENGDHRLPTLPDS